MKTNEKIILTICIIFLSIGMMFLGISQNSELKADALTALTVDILKVGKADAMIVEEGNKVMVLDTGEEDDGMEIVDALIKKNVSTINLMVITHFDKDHIGGADMILDTIPVKKVIIPNYQGAGSDYNEFIAALDKAKSENGTEIIKLTENFETAFGDAEILIEPPKSYDIPDGVSEMDNDFSLITIITHGENKLVFMGDAEKKRITEWLEGGNATECDFLKVPHHGVYAHALAALFDITRPKFAAICTSDKNPADSGTIELLQKYKTKVLETRDGNISVISDGVNIRITQKK